MIRIAQIAGLVSALRGKQNTLVDGETIKTINGTSLLGSGDLPIEASAEWGGITGTLSDQADLQAALDGKQPAGSYPEIATVTLTVPSNKGGRFEHEQTVADAAVSPSTIISPSLAAHNDSDENSAEMLSLVALSALAGSGQITFTLAFQRKESGPIKLNYVRG